MVQERPTWCPVKNCEFLRSSQGKMCGGKLAEPTEHDGGINTHHFCLSESGHSSYEVNTSDLDFFRWIFDALDGRRTSWLSIPLCEKCGNPMSKITEYECSRCA